MNSQVFELEIVRPLESVVIVVRWVDVACVNGNFLVGPGHSPLVSLLKPGSKLVYLPDDEDQPLSHDVEGGVLNIADGRVVALLES